MEPKIILISAIAASTNIIPGILLVIYHGAIERFFGRLDEIPVISSFGYKGKFFGMTRQTFIKYLGIWFIAWGVIFGFIFGGILSSSRGNTEIQTSQQNQ
jgi:hypothetical protein